MAHDVDYHKTQAVRGGLERHRRDIAVRRGSVDTPQCTLMAAREEVCLEIAFCRRVSLHRWLTFSRLPMLSNNSVPRLVELNSRLPCCLALQ
jgi:hypothetical protein